MIKVGEGRKKPPIGGRDLPVIAKVTPLNILFSSLAGINPQLIISEYELFENVKGASGKDNQALLICLLGHFQLFIGEKQIHLPGGGKSETLLAYLALQAGGVVNRERLIQAIWPDSDLNHGYHSLNNLVYNLNKLLGPGLQAAPVVLHEDGYYKLNIEAGIKVDITYFDYFVANGNRYKETGDETAAVGAYKQALELYRDDLYLIEDPQALIERERLRTSFLTLLSQMADYYFSRRDYDSCLSYLWQLLARDSYREDAHRLVMRCYVRQGKRANALHQYQICRDLMQAEFDAIPEPATIALFDQIRSNPENI